MLTTKDLETKSCIWLPCPFSHNNLDYFCINHFIIWEEMSAFQRICGVANQFLISAIVLGFIQFELLSLFHFIEKLE